MTVSWNDSGAYMDQNVNTTLMGYSERGMCRHMPPREARYWGRVNRLSLLNGLRNSPGLVYRLLQ